MQKEPNPDKKMQIYQHFLDYKEKFVIQQCCIKDIIKEELLKINHMKFKHKKLKKTAPPSPFAATPDQSCPVSPLPLDSLKKPRDLYIDPN